jgi:hypothetical protein
MSKWHMRGRLGIYTSRPFHWYKEHLNAKCFDPWTRALSFWESQRTPTSHFWGCEFHSQTYPKVGLRHSPWEFFNGVLHSTCTYRDQVDSQFLVVGSQIASLTPDLSFNHNLCCRCPNDSCKAISDIYTSRPFQGYKEHFDARCFDPWNHILNF